MEFTYDTQEKTCILSLQGNFLSSENDLEIMETAKSHIVKGTKSFICDLSKIQYLNSAGLQTIIKIFHLLKENNLNFLISGASSEVRNIFELTKLDKIMNFEENLSKALESI